MDENRLDRWQRNLDSLSKNSAKAGCGLIMAIVLIIGTVMAIAFIIKLAGG